MERASQIKKLSDKGKIWDMVVVGGGATGLGVAVDAATRGMSVACLEKTDFAKCTSSRSTKLVHGGVRYLQKGDVMLVLEALRERGRMKANAPHLVKDQAFVISNYRYWDNFLYFCGLTFYDLLSFGFGYGRSKYISAKKVMKYIPTSVEKGLKGGVVYHDGQFDDSRMAINLAQTCVENGGTVVNEATVTGILHNEAGKVAGVKFVDNTTGEEYSIKARSVVNAAGCFVDDIMHMDSPEHRKMVTPSQGVHLVLDMKFLQSDYAIMVPKTSDGRVLFAVPWHDKVVVGTTDIVRPTPEEEPRPLKEEIDFILGTAGLYMNPAPTYKDILSVFAGQRPLAAPKKEGKNTKEISRSHKVITSDNGLVTITGGKWKAAGQGGELTDEERQYFQERINTLHQIFKADVGRHMGLTADPQLWGEAQLLLAQPARELGLVTDIVRDRDAAIRKLAVEAQMTREELAAQSPELVDALLAEGRLKAEAENKANMDKAAADAVAGLPW